MSERKSMLGKQLHKRTWKDTGLDTSIHNVYEECIRRRDVNKDRGNLNDVNKWQEFIDHMDDLFYGQGEPRFRK